MGVILFVAIVAGLFLLFRWIDHRWPMSAGPVRVSTPPDVSRAFDPMTHDLPPHAPVGAKAVNNAFEPIKPKRSHHKKTRPF
jgi:hypothetical protein